MAADPWFTRYRFRGGVRVVPRNARGWAFFGILMAVVGLPTTLMATILPERPELLFVLLGVSLAVMAIGVVFAWRNAEVIDLREHDDD